MPAAKPALEADPDTVGSFEVTPLSRHATAPAPGPRRIPLPERAKISAFPRQPRRDAEFQPRTPAIIGEAQYRGLMAVDGVISGQMGVAGSTMTIKQRPKNGALLSAPELNGELTFKDMLRINGHVAGKISSGNGTLIVDASARVEAAIDVAVCVISGVVVGEVIGHERVEVGSGAEVNGNISTPALAIKPGAVFQGECRMLREENGGE
jgi:cytoskeletal protein CcmA (bactofilin family)